MNVSLGYDPAPVVTIITPTNQTYNSTNVTLNVVADQNIDTWWFENNTNGFVQFSNNITLNLTAGSNQIAIYANDSNNNTGRKGINFTFRLTNPVNVDSNLRSGSQDVSISGENENVQSNVISRDYSGITKNNPVVISSSIEFKRETGLREISFTTNKDVNDVKISIKRVNESEIEKAPENAIKYFSVESLNLKSEDLSEFEIKVELEKGLFSENNYDINDLKIIKYVDGEWEELDSISYEELSESYVFSAKTSSLEEYSVYASAISQISVEEDIKDEVVEDMKEVTDKKGNFGLISFITLIIIGIITFALKYYKSRK